MSSLFVATSCRLENGLVADLVSWSNADFIAAVSANPGEERTTNALNEVVFINNEVELALHPFPPFPPNVHALFYQRGH